MDNGIIYIDKVGLEGIITYHEAEFEIIGGYYYAKEEIIRLTVLSRICTI